jgi:hypothetical protein
VTELTLEIVEGHGTGTVVPVGESLLIGSGPDVDLNLADPCVSPAHARIATGASATIEDLHSSNGTFVNGQIVAQPAWLAAGDELLIGTTVLAVRASDQVHAAAVALGPQGWRQPERERPSPSGPNGALPAVPRELVRLLDGHVKRTARRAPVPVLIVVVVIVIVYLAVG